MGSPQTARVHTPMFRPSTHQRSLPPQLESWGGTLTGSSDGRTWTFTCNFSAPAFSVISLRRGTEFLQMGELATCSSQTGILVLAGGREPQVGDWVVLESVPAPPPVPVYQPQPQRLHPTTAQSDPTYQRWLRQGFTMGGWSGRSRGFRGRVYSP